MKVAVSIPDDIYLDADRAAARAGLNRSQLYARALSRYLTHEATDGITRRINEVLAEAEPRTGGEEWASNAGRALVDSEQWEW